MFKCRFCQRFPSISICGTQSCFNWGLFLQNRDISIFFSPTSLAIFSLSAGKRLVTGFPSMVVVLDTSFTFPSEDFSSRESLLWRSSEWDLFSITVCLLFDLTWVFYLSCCYRGSTQQRQRRHSVRRLRMYNVVMIISNEVERTCLIHRTSAFILPLCRCVD